MRRSVLFALTCFFATSICGLAPPTQAAEKLTWNFDSDDHSFQPLNQVELAVSNGRLVVTSTGIDPHFSTKVDTPAGWQHLQLIAAFDGTADLRVYWSTEKEPQYNDQNSATLSVAGSEEVARKIDVYFEAKAPVTSIRIDPFNKPGKMQVDSITLSQEAPPEPKPAPKSEATAPADIKVPEGFTVERLHSVDAEKHGSWVSMAKDDKGRLIVSDQYGKLHRVTPPAVGTIGELKIETIDLDIGMAQGLLYAFDSLYVMVSGPKEDNDGLFRVYDTNNDDTFDKFERLLLMDGGGEHGPHAIVLSPDGKSIHVCAGNHTDTPEFTSSRVPRNWQEDQLLPRMWDAGGHAVGKMAPGGWIAKVSPDGQQCELVSIGFRNEYDIAFNPEGELFTYDADMEWDVGTPWYRPTRVNHVTSGSEFGWRSGTGKWPTWYPDSLPAVVDIGQGSPTGIMFGTGARFPEKYQRALFIADWSYGVIYAVHLTPDGASYTGKAERFAAAAPLPATDMVVGDDGAFYFTIGGRRTQSGLYRITYTGDESTAAVTTPVKENADLRAIRRDLELLHVADAEDAIEKAWPYLAHADRHIRYAARIAVEHRPVAEWEQKALYENTNVDAKLTALLALARHGDASLQGSLLGSLAAAPASQLSEAQKLAALRVLGLAFIRMGAPNIETSIGVAEAISPLYPSKSSAVNRELCALLVYLNDDTVAEKTLALMRTVEAQEEQMHYALCLRALKDNWTLEQRTEYFTWFLTAANMSGGNSFGGFQKNIREEAIEALPDADAEALKDLLAKSPEATDAVVESVSRPFVKEWKVKDLVGRVEAGLSGRDFDNGKKMFSVTACYKCHRFARIGGIVGPDLTGVGRRFNARNLLESIIEPSKVISDQYEATVFLTTSGKQVIGRIVNLNGDKLLVNENMLHPSKLTAVPRGEIDETFVSQTSMMPNGLLNNLTEDEILDLIAYLQSGGDPEASVFSSK